MTIFKNGLITHPKSRTRLKSKAMPSFLGDVGLIKVVSEFSSPHVFTMYSIFAVETTFHIVVDNCSTLFGNFSTLLLDTTLSHEYGKEFDVTSVRKTAAVVAPRPTPMH